MVHRDPAEQEYVYHPIELEEKSELLRLYGDANFEVNSFHHQAVKVHGEGMKRLSINIYISKQKCVKVLTQLMIFVLFFKIQI